MSNAEKAADLLIAARRDENKMDALPDALEPATLADAYAIQDAIIARTDLSLAGWKVALTNDEAMARADATEPAAGPLTVVSATWSKADKAPFRDRLPASSRSTARVSTKVKR